MKEKDPAKVSAGSKGGITKWARISKKRRKKIMSAVAKARYAQNQNRVA